MLVRSLLSRRRLMQIQSTSEELRIYSSSKISSAPVDDIEPYAKYFITHMKQMESFCEKCPQSMSKTNKCPVCEYGTKL